MNRPLPHGFASAIRHALALTRERNVAEATRALLRGLSGAPSAASADQPQEATTTAGTQAPPAPPRGQTFERLRTFDLPGLNLPGGDATALLRQKGRNVETPPGAAYFARRYSGAAGARDYKVYIPSHVAAAPALIVMLHGCTQNADDFANGTAMNALAEEHGFIVGYPEQAKNANQMGCWNWFNPADQQRDSGEAAIIAGITRALISEYGVDPARVFVAGLSAGGAMAEVMSVTYPDLYAGAGVHSGLAYGIAHDAASAFTAMNGQRGAPRSGRKDRVRTIVFHGDADRKVHPANAELIVAEARAGLSSPVRETRESGTAGGRAFTCTRAFDAYNAPQVELWEIDGLGHAWSGGSPAGSHTDPKGPDASREMVRFFLATPPTA